MSLKRFYRELIALIAMGIMGLGMAYAAGTITGVVTDNEGAPLAFANVVITHKIVNGEEVALRSQLGTVTDLERRAKNRARGRLPLADARAPAAVQSTR